GVLDRVPEHNWVAAVPAAYADRSFVGVLVVLDVRERYPLRLEHVAEVGVEQLNGDIVPSPNLGEFVQQPVPVFLRALVDDVEALALPVICHTGIVAACDPKRERTEGAQGGRKAPFTIDETSGQRWHSWLATAAGRSRPTATTYAHCSSGRPIMN